MISTDLLTPANIQVPKAKVDVKQGAFTAVPAERVSGEQLKSNATASLNGAEKNKQSEQNTQEELLDNVAQLNDHMQSLNRNLNFSVDETSGETVIKVIDTNTEEVIRQIPTKEVLDARNAADKFTGLLLHTKV